MAKEFIKIGGARVHNLKNLSLSIPRDKLVVITGLSGSGKSSLAFDTIFAEGQRRYVESLSAYARQFLDQMEKPEVDFIEGLSPAIAIEQRGSGSNPRSIIATTTEIYDYLRLLYAHIGQAHCPDSGTPLQPQSTTDIVDRVMDLPARTRILLLAPVVRNQKGEFRDVIERLAREGFVRARIDGSLVELASNVRIKLDPKASHSIDVVVDRLVMDDKIRTRLGDSVETALKWGEGKLILLHQLPTAKPGPSDPTASQVVPPPNGVTVRLDDTTWVESIHSNLMFSPATGRTFEKPTPKHFSFNAPAGACPICHGLGQKMVFDEGLIVPNPDKSLDQGAILPWRRGGKRMISYYKSLLRGLCTHYQQNPDAPYAALPDAFKAVLMRGSGADPVEFHLMRGGIPVKTVRPFEGVVPNLERLFQESESEFTRKRLKAFMSPTFCDACRGRRLRPEILAVTLGTAEQGTEFIPPLDSADSPSVRRLPQNAEPLSPRLIPGLSIMELCSLSVEAANRFFASLVLTPFQQRIAAEIIKEIHSRLEFLKNVGLGYLTLDRESGTLSGGEAQRIRLATQIGSALVGVLYILDEPSIGLHQRDNARLLQTLDHLRDTGSSVLVVEHDEDTIRHADYIVDLGPGAGVRGGEVVAAGTLQEVLRAPKSMTAKYLSGELSIPMPKQRNQPSESKGWLEILGAAENNLKGIDVRIPLGTLTCVTGVSGSGKSTLVDDVLKRALFRHWFGSKERPGAHASIEGKDRLDKVIVIDQTPIGRTPRSNPATFTGMFNHIRDLFAHLPAARVRGYGPGRFSFNVKGGRCEKCQGDGLLKIEMHFLPPVYVTCEACQGRRYNRQTLEIHYKGMNIADVLDMTVDEAVPFFRALPQIHESCLTLAEVGLGYVRLGQSGTTLSGGEAQRLKLGAELSRKSTGRTLYILDEPTTGLHFYDVAKLLEVLFKLRAAGNTLLIIEHNLDVIKTSDWVIDLGPEGGSGGGHIVAQGPPEEVAGCPHSHTGQFLRRILWPHAS